MLPQILVNAVAWISDYRTMRARGVHEKRVLFILIDSGSTHNFMDISIAEKLRCNRKPAGMAKVSVTDGSTLWVNGKIEQFQWNFQTTPFQADFMIIPLGGCDMVLSIQWLETLGLITWDFKKLEMKFMMGKKKVLLLGIQQGSVREVKANKLNKIQEEQAHVTMVCAQDTSLEMDQHDNHPAIEKLLEYFSDVFSEPTRLHHFRANHNHKIPLIEGSNPINQDHIVIHYIRRTR